MRLTCNAISLFLFMVTHTFCRSSDFVLLDDDHLRKLDNVSRAARDARDDLKQAYHNDRSAQLRASMQRSKSSSEVRIQFFHLIFPVNVSIRWLERLILIRRRHGFGVGPLLS